MRSKTPTWAIVAIVLLLGVLGSFVLRAINQAGYDKRTRADSSFIGRVPQQHSTPIANTATTVNAASYRWFKFSVPAGADSVSVAGHFTAAGGSGNDIEVYLLSEDDFVNFQNGHEVRTFYNSGKITQGTIRAALPATPAAYYLVFDNRFSLLTPKAVQVNASLSYTQ